MEVCSALEPTATWLPPTAETVAVAVAAELAVALATAALAEVRAATADRADREA